MRGSNPLSAKERAAVRAIREIREWPGAELDALVAESVAANSCFLRRLREEWEAGENRFSREGEALFGMYEDGRLIAVGGVNRAAADGEGRLRRFYVAQAARRQGVGRELLGHILAFAARHYGRIVLRTGAVEADCFYRAAGFERLSAGGDSTHARRLGAPSVAVERSK